LDGSIKKYLIQPVDMIGFLLLSRVAHKLVYYTVAFIPYALVFFLCRGYFQGWPPPGVFVAFLASLVMAFLLGYFVEVCIGMIGFWFLEVTSLLFVYMLLNYFLSGQMFPIELLDGVKLAGSLSIGDLVRFFPFQYMAYFPTVVFLGKVTGTELTTGLAIAFAWCVFFIFAARLMFNRGVRRYSAFGG
jgi:ABC-2 type transport system permease protein